MNPITTRRRSPTANNIDTNANIDNVPLEEEKKKIELTRHRSRINLPTHSERLIDSNSNRVLDPQRFPDGNYQACGNHKAEAPFEQVTGKGRITVIVARQRC